MRTCTVYFSDVTSAAFPVSSGVKQGCVLVQPPFRIFFSMLLQYTFTDCTEGIYLCARANGKLLTITHLCSRTKVMEVLIHRMLFTNDATLALHTEAGQQQLVDHLSNACKEFGLTTSLKKTNNMAQNAKSPLNITINGCCHEMVHTFIYLRLTISSSLSLDAEMSRRIDKASSVMAKLSRKSVEQQQPDREHHTKCIPDLCS